MAFNRSSFWWWIFSVIFTLSIAYYQRSTGPTYPVRGKVVLNGKEIRYKLLTSNESHIPAIITFRGAVEEVSGYIQYRKFKTNEEWQVAGLTLNEGKLTGELPPQPPAGKLIYNVILTSGGQEVIINKEPVVIRFKGAVPAIVLFPHIVLMFLAMLYSTRTGIEALRKGNRTKNYTLITVVLLAAGGMILGPAVQRYAFGAFWTGWPIGHDLTDNKTLVAFLAWVIAYMRLRKNETYRKWAIAAAVILLLVYLIPHSMFGSELDYSTGNIRTGQ